MYISVDNAMSYSICKVAEMRVKPTEIVFALILLGCTYVHRKS